MKMIMINVLKPSKYAIDGVKIMEYPPGEHDVEKECAEIFCKEGWAEMVMPEKSISKKKRGG